MYVCIHVRLYVCIHVCMYVCVRALVRLVCVDVHLRTNVQMCVHVVYVLCMHGAYEIYACMYGSAYECFHICTYVGIYSQMSAVYQKVEKVEKTRKNAPCISRTLQEAKGTIAASLLIQPYDPYLVWFSILLLPSCSGSIPPSENNFGVRGRRTC